MFTVFNPTPRRTRPWFFLAGAAGILLSACGGAPLEQSAGGLSRATPVAVDTAATLPTEACRLLTPDEVTGLTGRPVHQLAQGAACSFVGEEGKTANDAVVLVSFRPAAAFQAARLGNDVSRNVAPVTGLGREAYFDDKHGDLYVQMPERTLVISLPRRQKDRDQLATALGRLAVGRLTAPAPATAAPTP